MMATLHAMRAGQIPPERISTVLGTVSTIVDSLVLDYLGDKQNEYQQKHR